MSKVNAKLYKQIMERMYPDPHKATEAIYDLYSHSLAEARREWDSKAEKARKFAVLPDPNPYGKWVSVKNHNRVVNQAFDLLTGDNPERKV